MTDISSSDPNIKSIKEGKIEAEIIPKTILFPFILLTSCFALWGLANNMTDVLIAQFRKVFTLTDMQSGLVQTAFYGAYFVLALPAALFIQRYSYKAGVLLGLGLFASGALLFYPAAHMMTYLPFLIALFILAGGLSILETSANPYVIAMGPEETATRRLNIAQAFNPVGSITGVLIGKFYILSQLNPASDAERAAMPLKQLSAIQASELNAVMVPYLSVAGVIVFVWLALLFTKMPKGKDIAISDGTNRSLKATFSRLLKKRHFVKGVIGQFLYIGCQIGCWSWTIRYVMTQVGGSESEASNFLLASIVAFSVFRFICVGLMKYFAPEKLLALLALFASFLVVMVMTIGGSVGAYSLVGISACMSLMFPTIFGLSLRELGSDSKFGGSCLIMSILGGAVLTAVMGSISDLVSIQAAFVIPFIGFIYLIYFGLKGYKIESRIN